MMLQKTWTVLLGMVFGILITTSSLFAEESIKRSESVDTPAKTKTNIASEKAQVDRLRDKLATMSRNDRLSPLFNTVARVVKPSVVVIRVTKKIKMNGGGFMFPGFGDLPPDVEEELRKRFGENHPFLRQRGRQKQRFFRQQGQGSGVIIDAENGYILTNDHVVGGADEVTVILPDEREFDAEWIRRDRRTDLAVVKIKADNLIASPLGDSDKAKVGHWVLAIGAPFGLAQTVTSGIVSAKGRTHFQERNAYQNFIQTDAAINRGNSGGPLVNMRGEVIGINTMILSPSGAHDGVGFAIPSNMARGIMKQLIDDGTVKRGYLGVGIQNMSRDYAESLGMQKPMGGLVTQVQPDSAAAKAGLELEDVITAVNGKNLKDVNELRNTIASFRPGETVTLTVIRDGKTIPLKVTLGKNPFDEEGSEAKEEEKEEPKPQPIKALEKLGLSVQTLDAESAEKFGYEKDVKGVLIVGVEEDSVAWDRRLRHGMVITNVGRTPVENVDQLAAALKDAKGGFRLRITTPQGGAQFVFLKPKE
ncbi:MAG: Do family serine endopeptidase [Phycisphaerae bacterium]|nr:Do family serine endopeptidase [Phycisphaerae bacterium]